jgi:hypothetical protein
MISLEFSLETAVVTKISKKRKPWRIKAKVFSYGALA